MTQECLTAECDECLTRKAVCKTCKNAGFTLWCPPLKRCDRCLEKKLQCHRAVCLNITTDCQSKLKTALERLQTEQREGTCDPYSTLAAPNPDIVHAGKNVHRSHNNWFLFIDDAIFCLVMLRTARLYSSCSEELKAVVTDVALFKRERQDGHKLCRRMQCRGCI